MVILIMECYDGKGNFYLHFTTKSNAGGAPLQGCRRIFEMTNY